MGKQSGRQGDRKQGTQRSRQLGGQQTSDRKDGAARQQGQQNVHGEGNYAASRQYNEATKDFAQSGRVESAARDAAPRSDAEAQQMAAAEAEGKRHAKGEDPALTRKPPRQPDESQTPRPGEEEE